MLNKVNTNKITTQALLKIILQFYYNVEFIPIFEAWAEKQYINQRNLRWGKKWSLPERQSVIAGNTSIILTTGVLPGLNI